MRKGQNMTVKMKTKKNSKNRVDKISWLGKERKRKWREFAQAGDQNKAPCQIQGVF